MEVILHRLLSQKTKNPLPIANCDCKKNECYKA